jgi:enoyl-[acyl-carrier-protein] reductase (NADH)
VLTYRWGSADEDELRKTFADLGAPEPLLVQADAGESEDTDTLLAEIRSRHERLDVFINNVAGATVVRDFGDLSERALTKSIRYSAWPLVEYLQKMKVAFGAYPRYVIAMSSLGTDAYCPGYELVATSKAVLETLCRYATYRLRNEDVRINVLRAGAVPTASASDMFGPELFDFLRRMAPPDHQWLQMEEVANVAVALCSGKMDAVKGQILTVDRGDAFSDNLMRLFVEREALGF